MLGFFVLLELMPDKYSRNRHRNFLYDGLLLISFSYLIQEMKTLNLTLSLGYYFSILFFIINNASITVFPVTVIAELETPSFKRFF